MGINLKDRILWRPKHWFSGHVDGICLFQIICSRHLMIYGGFLEWGWVWVLSPFYLQILDLSESRLNPSPSFYPMEIPINRHWIPLKSRWNHHEATAKTLASLGATPKRSISLRSHWASAGSIGRHAARDPRQQRPCCMIMYGKEDDDEDDDEEDEDDN